MDVNDDGWTDVVSANYRSSSLFWTQHPGPSLGEWTTHLIDSPGPSETGRLVDVDGDGKLDVLPNGTKFAAWYECLRSPKADGGVSVKWLRHDLPQQVAGHGIGLGDVNGDGRPDVVTPRGWCEGPANARTDRWRWHDEFRLHRDGSIPILVTDVDDDGDQDLVWGRAHNIGIYWLEQQQSESGERSWQQHAIDTSWSSVHSILLGDIDGDGSDELIAGKRLLGHDGKDPGEWDPLLIVAYRFLPTTRSWREIPISWGGDCGFDLDPTVADVDNDGDLDLVAPTRGGLCLLENLGTCHGDLDGAADTKPPIPQYAADVPLLDLRDVADWEGVVDSRRKWGYRRWQILGNMQKVMGPLPTVERRVPLDVRIESRESAEGYERIRLSYAAEPGDRVPAYMLVPNELSQDAPAMLCLHPTHTLGKDQICGLGGQASRFYAHELAQQGFICLAPDYPSFGEYPFEFKRWSDRYASGSMKAVWNNIRALDLLESWPRVDKDRIGCIGHSLGGHNALFTAALDQRIRAVVASCGFTLFSEYYQGDLTGWTSDRYMPRIRDRYGSDPSVMPFDFHEVLAAIAPRPIFVSAPLEDGNFAVGGVRKAVERVQPVYDLFGHPERIHVEYPAVGHDFPKATRHNAYRWLIDSL